MAGLLAFLRLVERDPKQRHQTLSLTNLAIWIVLVKMATSAQASGADLGVLLAALGNYAHRRHLNKRTDNDG